MPRWPEKKQAKQDELILTNTTKTGRVTEVRYERVFPIPNKRFETERFSLTSTVENGESINLVIEKLKRICFRNSAQGREDLEKARRIAHCPDNYSFSDVSWARAYLDTMGEQ